MPGRRGLQRLFSRFPGGWPGIGLLLLRGTVGLTAIVQGAAYLFDGSRSGIATWVTGLFAIISGASLLIGFFTPIASALTGLVIISAAFVWIPVPPSNLFEDRMAILFAMVMATAISLLGPGAFSLDARRFGRREIIIPPVSRSPES